MRQFSQRLAFKGTQEELEALRDDLIRKFGYVKHSTCGNPSHDSKVLLTQFASQNGVIGFNQAADGNMIVLVPEQFTLAMKLAAMCSDSTFQVGEPVISAGGSMDTATGLVGKPVLGSSYKRATVDEVIRKFRPSSDFVTTGVGKTTSSPATPVNDQEVINVGDTVQVKDFSPPDNIGPNNYKYGDSFLVIRIDRSAVPGVGSWLVDHRGKSIALTSVRLIAKGSFEKVPEFKEGDRVWITKWYWSHEFQPQLATVKSFCGTTSLLVLDKKYKDSLGPWSFKNGEFRHATFEELSGKTETMKDTQEKNSSNPYQVGNIVTTLCEHGSLKKGKSFEITKISGNTLWDDQPGGAYRFFNVRFATTLEIEEYLHERKQKSANAVYKPQEGDYIYVTATTAKLSGYYCSLKPFLVYKITKTYTSYVLVGDSSGQGIYNVDFRKATAEEVNQYLRSLSGGGSGDDFGRSDGEPMMPVEIDFVYEMYDRFKESKGQKVKQRPQSPTDSFQGETLMMEVVRTELNKPRKSTKIDIRVNNMDVVSTPLLKPKTVTRF